VPHLANKTARILPKAQYRVHNSPPLVPVLSKYNWEFSSQHGIYLWNVYAVRYWVIIDLRIYDTGYLSQLYFFFQQNLHPNHL
jgi:hypothetical protein